MAMEPDGDYSYGKSILMAAPPPSDSDVDDDEDNGEGNAERMYHTNPQDDEQHPTPRSIYDNTTNEQRGGTTTARNSNNNGGSSARSIYDTNPHLLGPTQGAQIAGVVLSPDQDNNDLYGFNQPDEFGSNNSPSTTEQQLEDDYDPDTFGPSSIDQLNSILMMPIVRAQVSDTLIRGPSVLLNSSQNSTVSFHPSNNSTSNTGEEPHVIREQNRLQVHYNQDTVPTNHDSYSNGRFRHHQQHPNHPQSPPHGILRNSHDVVRPPLPPPPTSVHEEHAAAMNNNVMVPERNPVPLLRLSELRQQGFPVGLASEVAKTITCFPLRFWIVDNSGSMMENDGHQPKFGSSSAQQTTIVDCTRWAELQTCVIDHIKLAGLMQVSTNFRMLNDPGTRVGPQEFCIADPATLQTIYFHQSNMSQNSSSQNTTIALNAITEQVKEDERFCKKVIRAAKPGGPTPLAMHLYEFQARIESVQHQLRSQGQQAVLVLATDGLPTDRYGDETEEAQKEVMHIIKTLQALPTWIVVRLCTDDRQVVDFYNDLDRNTELNLEVIDDFLHEAAEIHANNPWLNYALPLHRCREMGYHHRIFDLLDERPLNKDELREFLVILFGRRAMLEAPDIHTEFSDFLNFLNAMNAAEGKHWRVQSRRKEYWIDVKKIQRVYGEGIRWMPANFPGRQLLGRAYARVEL